MFIPTLSCAGPPVGTAIAAGIGGRPPAPPADAAGALPPLGAAATGAPPLPAGAAACGADAGTLRGASRGAAHASSTIRPSPPKIAKRRVSAAHPSFRAARIGELLSTYGALSASL